MVIAMAAWPRIFDRVSRVPPRIMNHEAKWCRVS
jgi:hypothetical protein